MSIIRGYIPHPNIPANPTVGKTLNEGLDVGDTTAVIGYLCNLQPPMWTVLGGKKGVGKSRLLEECTSYGMAPIKPHETLFVTLPDETPKPRRREEEATDLAHNVFRAIHQAWFETRGAGRGWFRRQLGDEGRLPRQMNFAGVFGHVRQRLKGTRRLILDNGHYLRHDPYTFKKVFELRKMLPNSLVLIFGVQVDKDEQPELMFNLLLEKVDEARATLVPSVLLLGMCEDDFPSVLQQVLFGLRALPDETFEQHEENLVADLWRVTWLGNWLRIEMLTVYLDMELRARDNRPRTTERPGVATYEMMQRVIKKLEPRSS
jgi:hypothetical protein